MKATTRVGFEVALDDADFSGEYPSIPLPDAGGAGVLDALARRQTHYVNVPGLAPLRDTVATFLSTLGITRPAEDVFITAGEQEARFLSLRTLLKRTEYVALPEVVAPGVAAALTISTGAISRLPVDRNSGLLPSISAIEQALADGSRLLYLESPGRLTGYIYTESEVRRIADLLETYAAYCIWDQSTAPAVRVTRYTSLAAVAPARTLAIGVLWPGMGLAGWQLGYILAPSELVGALTTLKQVMTICTSAPVQWAGVGVGEIFEREHAALIARLDDMRQELLDAVAGDTRLLVGQTVNTLAVDLGDAADAAREKLLYKNIRVSDGRAYGAPGIVRITIKPAMRTFDVLYSLLGDRSA